MRNFLGGFIGALVGAIIVVPLIGLMNPVYSWPFSTIWFILSGSSALKSTIEGILNPITILGILITWIIVGVVIALFSKKGWNTLRTVLWVGLILGILSLASIILLDATYWTSPTRNVDLIYHFATVFGVSLCSLPSALLTTMVIDRLMKQAEEPIPEKIETKCECGAIFRSNPMICSECGKQLREE